MIDKYGRKISVSDTGEYSIEGMSVSGVTKEQALETFNAHAPEDWEFPVFKPTRITAIEFWNRFSEESKLAVSTNPKLNVFVITALATGSVDLEAAETIQGMEFAVSLGVITEDEKKAILTP